MPPRSAQSFAPPPVPSSYRELLVFEERLKQNAERLQTQRRKYQLFLGSLILVILGLAYQVFVEPSIYQIVHYWNVGFLLVCIMTLILFFASGMYTEKISYAYKFVPQANRALRPFNVYLNTRQRSRLAFFASFLPFRTPAPPYVPQAAAAPSPSMSATSSRHASPGASPVRPTSPLSRSNSGSSSASSASAGIGKSPPPSPVTRAVPLAGSSSSPISRTGVPLAPIPPATNPRGEIIFSSRVSPAFREGYERYRGEWERRRNPRPVQRKGWWWTRWLGIGGGGSGAGRAGAAAAPPTPGGDETKELREKEGYLPSGASTPRGREKSRSISSRPSSRQSSPYSAAASQALQDMAASSDDGGGRSGASSRRSPSPTQDTDEPTTDAPLLPGLALVSESLQQRRPPSPPLLPSPKKTGNRSSPRVRAESFSDMLHLVEEKDEVD